MIQWQIEKLNETTSTNTLLLERARQGAPEGLVLVADHQTGGRGKPGRKWESPPGQNLLFSVLLRPGLKPSEAPLLTQIACRAIAKVLKDKYEIVSVFKRPNDLMVGGKKVCGILTEASSSGSRTETAIVGIGLNVNAAVEDLPQEATSMKIHKKKTFDRDEILHAFLEQLAYNLNTWQINHA